MKYLNKTQPRLPTPPISTADVPISELPTVTLRGLLTPEAPKGAISEAAERSQQRDEIKADEGTLYGVRDRTEAHNIGHLGELATGFFFNIPVDTEVYQDGDDGWDHEICGETTLDTKATETDAAKPKLIIEEGDTPPADYFTLIHIREDQSGVLTARAIGFTDYHTVVSQEPEYWPGNTLNYVLGWDDLYPPRFFNSLIKGRTILESEERHYTKPQGCQLCGAHLSDDSEYRLFVPSIGQEIGVCRETCKPLLVAARNQGTLDEFRFFERPPDA